MDNYHKYLPVSEEEKRWGIYVLCAGCARVNAAGNYPVKNHPSHHFFNWNNGRILQEYQIIYITRGGGVFESKTAGIQNIKAGSVIILFPGEWHRYRPDKETGWDEYWVGISGNIVDNLLCNNFFSLANPVITVGHNEKLFNLLTEVIEKTQNEQTGFQAIISSSVFNFLGHLYAFGMEAHLEDKHAEEIINRAKILFRANVRQAFSPEIAANELKVGYSWFRKTFKLYTGMAPGQYFIQLKIQTAKELLADPQYSVKAIAYELKFDCAFFSKLFKEKTGLTPLQFRDQYSLNLRTDKRTN